MALNIKNPETERLANEVARATGESLTQAVTVALRERLSQLRRARPEGAAPLRDVAQIQAFVARLRKRDRRGDDAILGYDKFGVPR